MNQPWLTISDWPVRAFEAKDAKKTAASATSSAVVNVVDGILEHDGVDHRLLGNAQLLRLLVDLLVHQRSAHEFGTDHVGPHPILGTLLGDDLGQADQAVLGVT